MTRHKSSPRNVYRTGSLTERLSILAYRAAMDGNSREAAKLYEQTAALSPEGMIRDHYIEAAAAHHYWADQRDNGNFPGNCPSPREREAIEANHLRAVTERVAEAVA